MAQLWARKDAGKWSLLRLTTDGYRLGDDSSPAGIRISAQNEGRDEIRLVRSASDDGGVWVLIANEGRPVRVNGLPLSAGIRALVDRDEIAIGRRWTYYFSTEERPVISGFPDTGQRATCPRCCGELRAGEPAVRCPRCGVWHHEDARTDLRCWTYAELCAACAIQGTSLEADSAWTPIGL